MLQLERETSSNGTSDSDPSTTTVGPGLLQGVLDGLAQGVAILDASARLTCWNVAARARLTAAGWTLADHCLHAPTAQDHDRLCRALTSACTRGRRQLLTLTLAGRPAHAALTPLEALGQRWAMLMLDREVLCGPIELQLFASHAGITPAELRVLARLSHGLRPAQIAREHGVSVTTVQSQVAALRTKTQSSSVTVLLNRLAQLPTLAAVHLLQRV